MNKIIYGDNVYVLSNLQSHTVDLIYIDPPFNTGKTRDYAGKSYCDTFDNYLDFIKLSIEHGYCVLKDNGSFFFHGDYREIHYVKILLDKIFGRNCFMNEIIWSYDYGGRSKKRWPVKHNTILWYAKNPKKYTFNYKDMDRIPYLAPNLCGPEKAAVGKTPTDVWQNTIVHTSGKERVGYPTQKPLSILNRIVKIHSNPGDLLLDFFAGSGSFGEAAAKNDRQFIMIDNNKSAIEIMKKRLAFANPEIFGD